MAKYSKLYRQTHIYIPIFGRNGNIFFNVNDYSKFCKEYHNFEHEYDLSTVNGDSLLGDEFAIGIFDNEHGTIAHELVHVVQHILNECMINPTDSHGEVMAYIMKYMFEIIEERMKKANG